MAAGSEPAFRAAPAGPGPQLAPGGPSRAPRIQPGSCNSTQIKQTCARVSWWRGQCTSGEGLREASPWRRESDPRSVQSQTPSLGEERFCLFTCNKAAPKKNKQKGRGNAHGHKRPGSRVDARVTSTVWERQSTRLQLRKTKEGTCLHFGGELTRLSAGGRSQSTCAALLEGPVQVAGFFLLFF